MNFRHLYAHCMHLCSCFLGRKYICANSYASCTSVWYEPNPCIDQNLWFWGNHPFLWTGVQWRRKLQRCKRWKVKEFNAINITEELIKPEGVSLSIVTRQNMNWIDWMFFLVTVRLSGLQCVVVTLHLLLVPQNIPNDPNFPHRLQLHNSRAQLDLQWRVHVSWYCQWRCFGPLLNKYFLNSLYNCCLRSHRLDNQLTQGVKNAICCGQKTANFAKNAHLCHK